MPKSELEKYKEYISTRLNQLIPLLQKYSIGDFSESIEIPEKEDEFTELLTGLSLMIDDLIELIKKEAEAAKEKARAEALQERTEKLEKAYKELEETHLASLNIMEDLDKKSKELQDAYDKLKSTQEQLIQAEKISSLGVMAGGIAHELNNPLTPILALSSMLVNRLPEDSPYKEDVEEINRSATRCKTIISTLLRFARKEEIMFCETDINQVVEDALEMVNYQLKSSKVNAIKTLTALPPIKASPQHLQQVFINIMLNTIDAMPDGGTLTITTRPLTLPSPIVGEDKGEGNFIEISFADTGRGIPKE
ncbi:MAG: histidine kinase dimerization/phospho-acceptor domain-containing protein, partial [Elusimicrobiota bacterium]